MRNIYGFVLLIVFGCGFGFAQDQPANKAENVPEKAPLVVKVNNFDVTIKTDAALNSELAQFSEKVVKQLREKMEKNPEIVECNQYFSIKQAFNQNTNKPKNGLEIAVGIRKDFYNPFFVYPVYNLTNSSFTEEDKARNISASIQLIKLTCTDPNSKK